ncbi:ABC-type transporter ATP-binding protein EcsA [Corynebacterium glaucum]|uniref:ABC-type transporter ATP-binding protein EcsA n=1 Tax=Corynebacterium glaucum TaxID=187491 RepID=A0A1Q2HZK4_9CORY|nr:ABC transporter ATP-binding protein [Corynebacterium glaucum]AQQ16295.1 ABC-type transporter ATP-binding protein EcsA [Corynebacterium glaucum]
MNPTPNVVVHTRDLTRSFGKKPVLNGIDLNFGPGIHGLLGRNGVGKSTLLSIIGGQLKPSGGQVEVFGETPFDNARAMDRTALTGVDTSYPTWSVANVFKGAALRYPHWDQTIADTLIADFSLDGALSTPYGGLSRGQRAMVAIIVGLASGTELLLLDEPYVGLDLHNTDVFYRHLLEQADSGRTIIMATHHIEDAAKVLDTAAILGRDGRVAAHVSADDADEYVLVASASEGATLSRNLMTQADAKDLGQSARVTAAGFDDLIEHYLEVS